MSRKQSAGIGKKHYIKLLVVLYMSFIYHAHMPLYADCNALRNIQLSGETTTYYLNISDFVQSFIQIPTSNVGPDGPIQSKYLAGRAPIYNAEGVRFGTCSASFLCMQTVEGTYTDISNYISADNGLVVSWFTPTTLINLELDTIVNSMVTECMVTASTSIGFNPFYGQTFNLIVSSDNQKIYFQFTRTGTIF